MVLATEDVPDFKLPADGQPGHDGDYNPAQQVGSQHQPGPVKSINYHPADQQEHQHRHRRKDLHRSHDKGRAGFLQHPPCQHDPVQAVAQA